MTSCEKVGAIIKSCPLVLAFVLADLWSATVARTSNEPCDGIKIPPVVLVMLEKSFPHWRIEKISDPDPSNQEAWIKKYPTACPGFVAGHFQKSRSVGYAFLLLPADQTKRGYRLVVFLETTKDHWRSIVLEKNDQHTP
jgi:hypothetical protein